MHRIRLKRLPKDLLIVRVINWKDTIASRHMNNSVLPRTFCDADTERIHRWTLREFGTALRLSWSLPLVQDMPWVIYHSGKRCPIL